MDSDLRRPRSVYYDPEIHELPSLDSSHPEQAPLASVQPLMDQAPPASSEALKESDKNSGQGKKAKDLKGMGKGQDKKKTSSDPKEKALDAAASLPSQTVDPLVSKMTT